MVQGVRSIEEAAMKKAPAGSIVAYRNITADLVADGTFPKALVVDGKPRNPWTGRIVVQVFPQSAWKPDSPPTIGIVVESVPEKDCARLLETLGAQTGTGIFQINLEPSKTVHTTFPIKGTSGCTAGINNIGYTVVAR